MPNHVLNKLEITGSLEDLEALKQRFLDENLHLDFQKVIPMPEDLNIEAASWGDWGYQALYGDWREIAARLSQLGKYGPFNERAELLNAIRAEMPEALALGEKYRANEERYGARHWYDWCREHWGTKWNAYDHLDTEVDLEDRLVLWFHTAWTPPYPVVQAMSASFPRLGFRLVFADEFLNYAGWARFGAGELLEESPESINLEAARELGFEEALDEPEAAVH